ncbi:YceI family protein [Streptomyces sp. Amel2xC10]|uniref:YceI family protein n=1 Tax=Streptomyces sp. Amel2xC10 TaxID=1305826 RepID=UPI000A08ED85|nr:YceI family protein [Streptomyces sp. Amel2xC10]SMF73736.1 Polyisoprenoid-binding protein YceI [Streptomyces sp. Amel2xC10]
MTTAVETGLWQLDATRSTIAISHVTMWGMVTVKGTFDGVSGEGEIRPDGTVRGAVTLDAASLDTKHTKRDEHLRSADFFDVEHHPTLVFAVREAVFRKDDVVEVEGQLTVRGVSRPQTVTVRVTESSPDAITLTTEFTVDRDQFGLGWNRLGMMRGLTTVTSTLGFTRG